MDLEPLTRAHSSLKGGWLTISQYNGMAWGGGGNSGISPILVREKKLTKFP